MLSAIRGTKAHKIARTDSVAREAHRPIIIIANATFDSGTEDRRRNMQFIANAKFNSGTEDRRRNQKHREKKMS